MYLRSFIEHSMKLLMFRRLTRLQITYQIQGWIIISSIIVTTSEESGAGFNYSTCQLPSWGSQWLASCSFSKSIKDAGKSLLLRKDFWRAQYHHRLRFFIEPDILRHQEDMDGQSKSLRGHPWPIWGPYLQRHHSYLLDEGPGVRNSNSTITAFSSNYIKIATRHELMKRVQWRRITWKLCSMSRLDVVSCRWRIYWTGSSMAHLTSQDTVCPSRSFWSLWWPWYWQLMAITPIFHFKREPFSHNISCSRTQFSITTAYGILSIRPFRALCWTSATAILHRVSWPLESNRRLLFEESQILWERGEGRESWTTRIR